MYLHMRFTLTTGALIAIAGCGGAATTPPGSLVAQGGTFTPQSIHATYSTRKSLLFVSDLGGHAVNIYQTAKLSSNPAPIAKIQEDGYKNPYGLAVDKAGTIYVANDWTPYGDVELYPKGSTTMKSSITSGISGPDDLAIDSSGTLYVSNTYPPSITEYAYGTNTPSNTITGGGMVHPSGLALDKSGNLYIADYGALAVFELPAGSSSVSNLNLSALGEPRGLAIDPKTGYLWETGGYGNVINIYNLAKGTSPIKTITGNGYPYAISIQQKGKPVGEVVTSDTNTLDVYAYKPGQYTPYATLNNGFELPTGLLIAKP